ncbi:hypothetical protein [Nitrosospira briensis]|uniref:hypothetical protein n=1 Tax=Nitrosospira briensis TaxID=35799 RepID=UPI0008EE18EE|nr:hypothetical protein [Nitrosospira briensis]SFN73108.1 hypothetical protein SAMN05216332_101401 [Nitrosospira briensis]
MAKGFSGLGAFAGGLAEGLRAGQEMGLRRQYVGRKAKADERDAEFHQAKMDEIDYNKEKRARLRAANDEIVAGWPDAMQRPGQYSTQAQPLRLALGLSAISAQTPTVVDTRAAGLASVDEPVAQAQRSTSSDEMIGKRMLIGNLLEDPDELSRMASVYRKYGLLEEMAPWMSQAYTAKKKRIPDALHLLLSGDVKGARAILRKGGIKLGDDPIRTISKSPQQNVWKFKFENGREEDIDLKEFAAKFFPENSLK